MNSIPWDCGFARCDQLYKNVSLHALSLLLVEHNRMLELGDLCLTNAVVIFSALMDCPTLVTFTYLDKINPYRKALTYNNGRRKMVFSIIYWWMKSSNWIQLLFNICLRYLKTVQTNIVQIRSPPRRTWPTISRSLKRNPSLVIQDHLREGVDLVLHQGKIMWTIKIIISLGLNLALIYLVCIFIILSNILT